MKSFFFRFLILAAIAAVGTVLEFVGIKRDIVVLNVFGLVFFMIVLTTIFDRRRRRVETKK